MSFSSFLPINEARYAVKEKDSEGERDQTFPSLIDRERERERLCERERDSRCIRKCAVREREREGRRDGRERRQSGRYFVIASFSRERERPAAGTKEERRIEVHKRSAGVKMEHFQATLDPRKQELLEARFLGARVSCL
ncbi:hypothetical protein ALC56_04525 [Trachymyrmex septentrionalis]|uniref:Uncharacterized protein n=1 Tax=Trachymyrmex septentrionalis TaxID=34720 RepID=A0A195FLS8_9HYME|nr:hypothetical protein ALC56_04525 [Trachymyrmex septentrionalis]